MSTLIPLMGIDPGMTNTGWSIGHYNQDTGSVQVVASGVIQANAVAKKENRQDFKMYSKIVALDVYRRELKMLMEQYHPAYVASEDAFYNPHMPNAFLSLKLCIHTIQQLLYQDYRKPLYCIAPKLAKQTIWGNGTANKEAVQEGIQQHEDLILKNTKSHPLDKMVEHEADSIAIMYTFSRLILPDLLLQMAKN